MCIDNDVDFSGIHATAVPRLLPSRLHVVSAGVVRNVVRVSARNLVRMTARINCTDTRDTGKYAHL